MEPTNHCHPIGQWKRRRKHSRSSRCGARARWARSGYDKRELGLGRGEREDGGRVKQKKDSGREGGKR